MISAKGLHHVGIIAATERAALAQMSLLGLKEIGRGYVERWSALCIFASPGIGPPIEFVVADGGPLKNFNHGAGGVHHVAIRVGDLAGVSERLRGQGIRMLAEEPVQGAGAFLCNFISPIYTKGALFELIEQLPGAQW